MEKLYPELTEIIVSYCSQSTLYALALTNKAFWAISLPRLYTVNVETGCSSAVFNCFFGQHATDKLVLRVLKKAVVAGADIYMHHSCPLDNHLRLYGTSTPLELAVCSGFDGVIEFLLDNGVDVTENDIIEALKRGRDAVAVMLIRSRRQEAAYTEDNLLHWAVVYRQLESTQVLVEAGYYINELDGDGYAPLQAAIQQPSKRMEDDVAFVAWLLKQGANINQVTIHGTPLSMACIMGRFDFAYELLNLGAKIGPRDFGDAFENEISINSEWCDVEAWKSYEHVISPPESAILWSRWLLSLRSVMNITPCGVSDKNVLNDLRSHRDEVLLGVSEPHPSTETPIDVLLDATLCGMLSAKCGNADAATLLLNAGCRIPGYAFRCIIEVFDTISKDVETFDHIDHIHERWPTLLQVLPVFLSHTKIAMPSFQSGVAQILRLLQNRYNEDKRQKRKLNEPQQNSQRRRRAA